MLCQAAAVLIAFPASFTSQLPAAGPLAVHLSEVSPFTGAACSGFCTAATLFLKSDAINNSNIRMGIALLCGSVIRWSKGIITCRCRLITNDEFRVMSITTDTWYMGSRIGSYKSFE